MNKCLRCKKRLSKKKTAWDGGKTYCSKCCGVINYLKKLKRNNHKEIDKRKRQIIPYKI